MLIDILGGRESSDPAVKSILDQMRIELGGSESVVLWDKVNNPFIAPEHRAPGGIFVESKRKVPPQPVTRLTFLEHSSSQIYGNLSPEDFAEKLIEQLIQATSQRVGVISEMADGRKVDLASEIANSQIQHIDLLGCGCGVGGIDSFTGLRTESIAEIVSRKLFEKGLSNIEVHALSEEVLPAHAPGFTLLRVPKATGRGWELDGFKNEKAREEWFQFHESHLRASKDLMDLQHKIYQQSLTGVTKELQSEYKAAEEFELKMRAKLLEVEKSALVHEMELSKPGESIRQRLDRDPRCTYQYTPEKYARYLEDRVKIADATLEILRKEQKELILRLEKMQGKASSEDEKKEMKESVGIILKKQMDLCHANHDVEKLTTQEKAKYAKDLFDFNISGWEIEKKQRLELFHEKVSSVIPSSTLSGASPSASSSSSPFRDDSSLVSSPSAPSPGPSPSASSSSSSFRPSASSSDSSSRIFRDNSRSTFFSSSSAPDQKSSNIQTMRQQIREELEKKPINQAGKERVANNLRKLREGFASLIGSSPTEPVNTKILENIDKKIEEYSSSKPSDSQVFSSR